MVCSCKCPHLTMYAREHIRQILSEGSTCREVATALSREGIHTCRKTVWRLEWYIKAHGTVLPLPKSGRLTILMNTALRRLTMLCQKMTKPPQSFKRLEYVSVSKSTALKGRHLLGWTSRGAAYCQLIREQNCEKRLHWAQKYIGKDLMMSSGLTKHLYSWRLIEGFVVVNVDKNGGSNPVLNTRQRYMCGLE